MTYWEQIQATAQAGNDELWGYAVGYRDFVAEQYDALTDTAYEVVTAPAVAIRDVTGGLVKATGTVADATAKAAEDAFDFVKYAPLILAVIGGSVGFYAYKQGLFK